MRFSFTKAFLLVIGCLLFVFFREPVIGQQPSGSDDAQFAVKASLDELTEVDLGKAAYQKASNENVKLFAQRMVDDHSQAGDELAGIASKDSLTIPMELDAEHKAIVEKCSKLSGAAFDRAYLTEVVKDHQQDLVFYRKEAAAGSNSDLKAWARKILPDIEEHIRMAQIIERSLRTT